MRGRNRTYLKLIFVILFLSVIMFQSGIDLSKANGIISPLMIYDNFNFTDFTVVEEFKQNKNSIDLQLPSESWQIQDLELNFTDMEFTEHIEAIEDKIFTDNFSRVYYQNSQVNNYGLAVQINLAEPTILYGVYIYGYMQPGTKTIQVQITGYDAANHRPNSTILHTQAINMSTVTGWYLQQFSPELTLSKGNYFLVLNGSNLNSVADSRYYWYFNNIDPKIPELYNSYQIKSDPWILGFQNSTFLYKLHQKINTPKYPEAINMSINFNEVIYPILNGIEEGTGFLPKTVVNFFPNSDMYDIIVSNNASETLIFNVSVKATLSHLFVAPGSVFIDGSFINAWKVTPTIIRQTNNHSVLFYFPYSWQNISILRNEFNITLDVLINLNEYYILITNDSIINGANWEIIGYTPSITINLNIQRTTFDLGQELRFSLLTPILPGQYTFVLYDSAATKVYNETKNIPLNSAIFSYELPVNGLDGIYTAYIFWYDGINAGFQTQDFTVSFPANAGPDFPFLPLILLILFIGAGVGIGGYLGYKKLSLIRRDKFEAILDKCTDIAKINYIIVLDNRSGIDLFSESFGGKKLDPTLLAGFLQAIRNFGKEMSEEAKESRTLKLEYKDSIILMTEFVNLKLIITLKENPSYNFKFSMEDLAFDIYTHYGREIDKFSGNLKPFRGIKDLTEKHLNVSFLYPMIVVQNPKLKLNNVEEEMVKRALAFMKENRFDYFYSLYLMPENVCTPKDYQTIIDLIKKEIFKPIEIENNNS